MISGFYKDFKYTNEFYKDVYFEVTKVSEVNEHDVIIRVYIRNRFTGENISGQHKMLVRKDSFMYWSYYGVS